MILCACMQDDIVHVFIVYGVIPSCTCNKRKSHMIIKSLNLSTFSSVLSEGKVLSLSDASSPEAPPPVRLQHIQRYLLEAAFKEDNT